MEKYYRLSEIKENYKMSKSTIYRLIKKNSFPEPTRLSKRMVRWPKSKLEKWETERGNCSYE